ncbi:MAG: ABC transporter permease [Flavobacteriaceae bacterium]|nr:ABC transporter permease [Flavobacteriaceae bacterium]MBL6684009.1 ABC transporter permease [Flavobacteriaceae bacterium]
MKFESFLSSKIFSRKRYKKSISSPIIKISTFSVSISLIVMMLAISTGFGVQNKIKTKFSNIFGDFSIDRYENDLFNSNEFISSNKIQLDSIKMLKNFNAADGVIYTPSVIPSSNSFEEVVLKGLTNENSFLKTEYLIDKIDEIGFNEIIISKNTSSKLNIKKYDTVMFVFYDNNLNPAIRNLKIIGYYQTGIKEFDDKIIISNINLHRNLKKIDKDNFGSYELSFTNKKNNYEKISKYIPPEYAINYNEEKFSEIYNWISLFDLNIYLIIILMLVVGSINMITALLVTILEKTSLIGFLKILGSNNKSIKQIFLFNGLYLILKGMLYGNLFSLIMLFFQKFFKIIKLDPNTYYMDHIPVEIDILKIIILNFVLITISYAFLILPVKIISKIKPYSSVRIN